MILSFLFPGYVIISHFTQNSVQLLFWLSGGIFSFKKFCWVFIEIKYMCQSGFMDNKCFKCVNIQYSSSSYKSLILVFWSGIEL